MVAPEREAVTVIVLPLIPDPATSISGVLSFVFLSELELPKSELVARSGAEGAAGRTDKLPVLEEVAKDPLFAGARLAPTAKVPVVEGVYVMVARKLDGEKRNVLEVPISAPAT